jgi:DNA-binding response OmpR family regulator
MSKETENKEVKKILVVEDDVFLSDIYCTKLQETDFEVDLAITGEECLQKIKEKKYDLMILDIVLPKIDGWEILAKIQEMKQKGGVENGNVENLKIIILSNLGQKEEIQKGLRLGASSFMIKAHFTPSQILEEVIKTVNQ